MSTKNNFNFLSVILMLIAGFLLISGIFLVRNFPITVNDNEAEANSESLKLCMPQSDSYTTYDLSKLSVGERIGQYIVKTINTNKISLSNNTQLAIDGYFENLSGGTDFQSRIKLPQLAFTKSDCSKSSNDIKVNSLSLPNSKGYVQFSVNSLDLSYSNGKTQSVVDASKIMQKMPIK
jgi:hypothetical protein